MGWFQWCKSGDVHHVYKWRKLSNERIRVFGTVGFMKMSLYSSTLERTMDGFPVPLLFRHDSLGGD